jgi:hypothetical protein
MEHTLKSIRADIAKGRLDDALQGALAYAEYCGLTDIANALLNLSGQYEAQQRTLDTGQIDHAEFARTQARVTHGLLAWLDRLPDRPVAARKRRRLLTEATFKNRLLYLLCLIKAGVLGWLYYHWSTGGFSLEQFQATAALLTPTLVAYLSVMAADYLRQHEAGPRPPHYLSGRLVTFGYWLFPVYGLLLGGLIAAKAAGTLSFGQMNAWLALVESVLGGYIGQVVFSLFKQGRG